VELTELQRLASAGQLQPSDLVWRPGMPLWIPAEDTRGLFAPQRLQYPAPPAPLAPQVVPVEVAAGAPAPAAGPAPVRPPARPRPRTPAGMSTGAKVALFGGLAAAAVLVVILVIVLASKRGPRVAPAHDRGTYTVNLNENARDVRFVRFAANHWVTISVTSDFNTDVDLYVFDDRGAQIASDIRPDRDCFVNFRAPRSGMYRIEVVNLGRGPNRSKVRYN
jgi:hypothetical protein